jgi:hypothetical protein
MRPTDNIRKLISGAVSLVLALFLCALPVTQSRADLDLGKWTKPAQGLQISGATAQDRLGKSVASAGDINDDGHDDVIIGANEASPQSRNMAGLVTVVFGKSGRTVSTVDTIQLSSFGFKVFGKTGTDWLGWSVSGAGDVNRDGIDDFIMGAPQFDPASGVDAGAAVVIFGKRGAWTDIDLTSFISGSAGFWILGAAAGDQLGFSVSGAGDVNGDGADDVIVGAYMAAPSSRTRAGASYVVFGHRNTSAFNDVNLESFASGQAGFKIIGARPYDQSGYSVSGGFDINGDRLSDVIVGAYSYDGPSEDRNDGGAAYVIFGHPTATPFTDIDLEALPSSQGFSMYGGATDENFGRCVGSAGDFNGDGVDDIIVSAPQGSPQSREYAGIVYVIFGKKNLVNLDMLDFTSSAAGLVILGEVASDQFGWSVSGGTDVNGDRIDDVVVGSLHLTGPPATSPSNTYVIYGRTAAPTADINLRLGLGSANGFKITSGATGDGNGRAASMAGDFDGDGVGDLVTGAVTSSQARSFAGAAFLIYGEAAVSPPTTQPTISPTAPPAAAPSTPPTLTPTTQPTAQPVASSTSDLDLGKWKKPSQGLQISGATADDRLGKSVASAGDINGDGHDDLIIGANEGSPQSRDMAGLVTVVFGQNGRTTSTVDTIQLAPSVGFKVLGKAAVDWLGFSVSGAGDVNEDGIDDFIMGAPQFDPPSRDSAGAAVVIFGKRGTWADIDLASFTSGSAGFWILGAATGDQLGYSVSGAGDVNGDGADDVIVGASTASPADRSRAGACYVLFGHSNATAFTDIDLVNFQSGQTGFRIRGARARDSLGTTVSGAFDINDDGYSDVLVGANSYDGTASDRVDCGAAYVIFGHSTGTSFTEIDLVDLSSNRGFQITGALAENSFGKAVSSAGDFNHDGCDDIVVGVPQASPSALNYAGGVCILFGHKAPTPFPNVDMLTFTTGATGLMVLGGVAEDQFGYSVSGGSDVNGDGIHDIVVGILRLQGSPSVTYVIYGRTGVPSASIDLRAGLSTAEGFKITSGAQGDANGRAVGMAGDFDGDGVGDIVTGALTNSQSGRNFGGAAFLIYGQTSVLPTPTVLPTMSPSALPTAQPSRQPTRQPTMRPSISPGSDLDLAAWTVPAQGLEVLGAAGADLLGYSVADAGDVNKDGYSDLIVGAYQADPQSRSAAGIVYVVFGARDRNAATTIDTIQMAPARGFKVQGKAADDNLGWSVSGAGDFNRDGIDDFIMAAPSSDYQQNRADAGAAVVIFGKTSGWANIDLVAFKSGDAGLWIYGAAAGDNLGSSVSAAGDVNGDGTDDVIVGARHAGQAGGASYVLFGHSNGTAFVDIDLASFQSGPSGFRIFGAAASDESGYTVSGAFDMNGDHYSDVLVASYGYDGVTGSRSNCGAVYVIFGHSTATAFPDLDLSELVSSQGFRISGANTGDNLGKGAVSSAGDFNGDGYDDIVIGAYQSTPSSRDGAGKVYVLFGHAATVTFQDVDLQAFKSGDTGFQVWGAQPMDRLGYSVSGGADVNGDGLDDIVVGATGVSPLDRTDAGITYVLYGRANTTFADLDLSLSLPATFGYKIFGAAANDNFGSAVSLVRDFDGDRRAEVFVGATLSDPVDRTSAGRAYLVYGASAAVSQSPTTRPTAVPTPQVTKPIPMTEIQLNNFTSAAKGFQVLGAAFNTYLGSQVAAAGDVNADGYEDVFISAPGATVNGKAFAGVVYLMFGASSRSVALIDTAKPPSPPTGIRILGPSAQDQVGWALGSAGDFNHDGTDDFILGLPFRSHHSRTRAGAAVVIFGKTSGWADIDLAQFNSSSAGFWILGAVAEDRCGCSVSAAGDFNGDGIDDVIVGAMWADPLDRTSAGASYVIFGYSTGNPYPDIDLRNFATGSRGFKIYGAMANDFMGMNVTGALDFNNDGFDDVIVSGTGYDAAGSDIIGASREQAGAVYVIFGRRASESKDIDLNVPAVGMGFRINGIAEFDQLGSAMSRAGDFNGDGIDDLVLGARLSDPGGLASAGAVFVIFGHSNVTAFPSLDLATFAFGRAGLRIFGAAAGNELGMSVSGGADVNGDGVDDIVLGAVKADPSGRQDAGSSYVVFGSRNWTLPEIRLQAGLPTSMGFILQGAAANDYSGIAVALLRDFDGDGVGDVVVGAREADAPQRFSSGAAYLLYGTAQYPKGPSAVPTRVPTRAPSQPPPLGCNITVTALLRTSIRVRVTTTGMDEGSVQVVAVARSASSAVVSVALQSATAVTVNGYRPVTTNITNLLPLANYDVYCSAKTSQGISMSLNAVAMTKRQVRTACCKFVTVSILRPSTLFVGTTIASALSVAVDSPPSAQITVTLTHNEPGVLLKPSAVRITNTSAVGAVRSLQMTAFTAGSYLLTASVTGLSAQQYQVKYVGNRELTVLATAAIPPVPQLLQAMFSNDGGYVAIDFDSSTDRGRQYGTFPCRALLRFVSDAAAKCQWSTDTQLRVFMTSAAVLQVGGNVTLVSNTVRALCRSGDSSCKGYDPVSSALLTVVPPLSPTTPTVSVAAPSAISGCNALTLDLAGSTGAGGRSWSSMQFSVSVSPASESAATRLQQFLSRNYTLSPPTPVPSAVLAKGHTYAITATLCNFLQACGSATAVVSVSNSSEPLPLVAIAGGKLRSVYRTAPLSVLADAYTLNCDGSKSSANLQITWSALVQEISDAEPRGTSTRFPSQNPAVFRIAAYTLNVGATYTLTVSVRSQSGKTATAAMQVLVLKSDIVAVLKGVSTRYTVVGELVTLDASGSYDEDYPGVALLNDQVTYEWSCLTTLPEVRECAVALGSTQGAVLNVTAESTALNTTSAVSVTVSDGERSSTATVSIVVRSAPSPRLAISAGGSTDNVNTGKPFTLLGSLYLLAPCTAKWTVDDPTLSLPDAARTPTELFLVPAKKAAVPFNLVLNANALPQRSTLVFTLSCGSTAVSATVTTNGAPLPGRFSIAPDTGDELVTAFTLYASEWADPDLPLTYQFGFQSGVSKSVLVIATRSELANAVSTLPAGDVNRGRAVDCTVRVFDAMDASTDALSSVIVNPMEQAAKSTQLLLELVQSTAGSVANAKAALAVVSGVLNAVNCTAAPDCAVLNRNPCAKTDGHCGSCLVGYVGDAGDRNTLCVLPSTPTALSTPKDCGSNCSFHGECTHVSRITGARLGSCTLADTNCDAICMCTDQRSGEFCELDPTTLRHRREVRSNLIQSLSNLTAQEDINEDSVVSWSESLYSLSLKPQEVSVSDAARMAFIANTTLQHALAVGLGSYTDVLGVLQATDAVASLNPRNYNPAGYNDADFNTSSTFVNNTAAGFLPVVSTFGDLVASTMVLGENATALVYDNFRLSVSVAAANDLQGDVRSLPLSPEEQALGDIPSVVLLSPTEDAGQSTVAVKLLSTNPRSYTTDTTAFVSSPVGLQLQTTDVSNIDAVDYLSSIEFTFQHNEPQDQYVHYEERKFTSTCTARNASQTFAFRCPDSDHVIHHNCSQGAGEHVSYCPKPSPGCARLNTATAGLSFPSACKVKNATAEYTTCECTLVQDSSGRRVLAVDSTVNAVLDDTGSTDMLASTVFIGSNFADSFKSAQALNEAGIAKVMVVAMMMIVLWAPWLLVIGSEYAAERYYKAMQKVQPAGPADATHSLLEYIDRVIPKVFRKSVPMWQRLAEELKQHHLLFQLTSAMRRTKPSERRSAILRCLTELTLMIFLTAVFFDVSVPSDDGTCAHHTAESSCLERRSPFDHALYYCTWTDTVNDGDAQCAYNTHAMSTRALFYLTVLTTVLSSLASVPVDFLFTLLKAPTVEYYEGTKMTSVKMESSTKSSQLGSPTSGSAKPGQGQLSLSKKHSSIWQEIAAVTSTGLEHREIPMELAELRDITAVNTEIISDNASALSRGFDVVSKQQRLRATRIQRGRNAADKHDVRVRPVESTNAWVYAGSEKSSALPGDVVLQRILMKDGTAAVQTYDAQWGVVTVGEQQYKVCAEAKETIGTTEREAIAEADTISKQLANYSSHHAGLEILHQFMVDLLGRSTLVANIYQEKFGEEFANSTVVTLTLKFSAAAAIAGLNAFFLYYILLTGVQNGLTWQYQYLGCCLVQLAVDLLLFETVECAWLNFLVPQYVHEEVSVAAEALRALTRKLSQPIDLEGASVEAAAEYKFFLDAPAHLFPSVMVAKSYPQLLESMIVSSYRHHLPGEICKTWPHCAAQDISHAAPVNANTVSHVPVVRAVLRGLSVAMVAFIAIPYTYQRILLRLLQPVAFSGISIIFYNILKSPYGLAFLSLALAVLIGRLLWRLYADMRHPPGTVETSVAPAKEEATVFIEEEDLVQSFTAPAVAKADRGQKDWGVVQNIEDWSAPEQPSAVTNGAAAVSVAAVANAPSDSTTATPHALRDTAQHADRIGPHSTYRQQMDDDDFSSVSSIEDHVPSVTAASPRTAAVTVTSQSGPVAGPTTTVGATATAATTATVTHDRESVRDTTVVLTVVSTEAPITSPPATAPTQPHSPTIMRGAAEAPNAAATAPIQAHSPTGLTRARSYSSDFTVSSESLSEGE